jgi:hypothetical protein
VKLTKNGVKNTKIVLIVVTQKGLVKRLIVKEKRKKKQMKNQIKERKKKPLKPLAQHLQDNTPRLYSLSRPQRTLLVKLVKFRKAL